jgi:CheY-like chemotaxis protein
MECVPNRRNRAVRNPGGRGRERNVHARNRKEKSAFLAGRRRDRARKRTFVGLIRIGEVYQGPCSGPRLLRIMTSLQGSNQGRSLRVALVVEDHPDTQSALAAHLEQHGWDVALASDGDTAVRIAHETKPALICLDLNLPNISGYDVCEQLRSDPTLEGAIILMMSARCSVDVHAYSLEAGADAYLPKPYDLDEVLLVVERLRARRSIA